MRIIETLQTYSVNLSRRNFYLILGTIMSATALICSIILYRHYGHVTSLQTQLRRLNKDRGEARELLSKDLQIKKQRTVVEEMLQKNKNFKLMQYFDTTINKLNLEPYIKDKQISVTSLENLRAEGYSEIRLTATLVNMNTQQLAQLLYEIEQNELVFTKRVEITKSATLPAIDAEIIIATIHPKAE